MPSAETQPTLPVPGMLTGQRVVPIDPIATALGFPPADHDDLTLGQLLGRIHWLHDELKSAQSGSTEEIAANARAILGGMAARQFGLSDGDTSKAVKLARALAQELRR